MTAAVGLWGIGDRYQFPDAPGANTLTNTTVWHVSEPALYLLLGGHLPSTVGFSEVDPYMIEAGRCDGGPSHPSIGAAILFGGADADGQK